LAPPSPFIPLDEGAHGMGSALFSPIALRGLQLANRIVVSSMC
jgi:hypothetical protein